MYSTNFKLSQGLFLVITHTHLTTSLLAFARFASIPHTFSTHAVNLWQVYTNWYLQTILFSPSSTHSVCLFVLLYDKCYKVSLCSECPSVINYLSFTLSKKVLRTTNKKKKTDNPIKKDLSGQLREPNTNSSSIIIYYQNTVKKKGYDLWELLNWSVAKGDVLIICLRNYEWTTLWRILCRCMWILGL